MAITNITDKVNMTGLGLTLHSANPLRYPIIYNDDAWDIVSDGTKMNDLTGSSGSYTQHEINEILANHAKDVDSKLDNVKNILNEITKIGESDINSLFQK